ncbi:MAG: N-6 DNA methylase [Candidatus Humimicrobiaceae bacterium]
MMSFDMKKKINTLRDILVGKVPDPKSQVEQITIAMVFKFMDDMDKEFLEDEFFGGERKFFVDTDEIKYSQYAWTNLMNPQVSGQERADLYREGVEAMQRNPNLPDFFKDVFRNAYIPFRDSETINLFLKEINEFTYNSQNSEDLGEAFEMLLSIMSSQGDAGQFRTPRHIIDMIVDIVQPTKMDKILDPACGSAGFLISAYKFILSNNKDADGRITLTPDDKARLMKNFEGYDISQDMVRLSRVNMYLHHFSKPKVYEYDTLTSQDRWDDQFDVIFANPPFMTPKGGINPHNRFRVQAKRSEILFVDYISEHLAPNGRAGIIVPEGIVFQSANAYKELRKYLVDEGLLYAVISLPAGVFNPYSGVKTSVLLIDKAFAKQQDSILFVKVDNDGYNLGAQRRAVEGSNISEVVKLINAYKSREDVSTASLCILASKAKISEQDYVLVGERYCLNEDKKSSFPTITLGDLCETASGGTPNSSIGEYYNNGSIKWLKSGEVSNGFIYACETKITEEGLRNSSAKIFPINTVVVAMYGATAGQVGILKTECATNQAVCGIYPNNKLIPEYLYYYLKTKTPYLISLSTGGAQPNISQKIIRGLQVPLPPLDVQMHIVAEIESYRNVIEGAKQVVSNYRPKLIPNSNWKRMRIGDVCDLNPQKSEVRTLPTDTEVSFVPMSDINERQMLFSTSTVKIISDVYSGYTYFADNDVLLAKVTPCFENGKAGVARNLKNGIGFGSSEFYVLRPKKDVVLPEIVYCAISSSSFLADGKNNMTGTGGLQRLTKDYVVNYSFLIPSIAEQKLIVDKINEEVAIVSQCMHLIKLFEQKIDETFGQVWNSGEGTSKMISFQSKANAPLKFAARNLSDKFVEAVKNQKDGDSDE